MADNMADPLRLLRHAVAEHAMPTMLTSADPSGPVTDDISTATHLIFPADASVAPLSLSTPTRFVRKAGPNTAGGAIDLRAAYFCWLCRDENVAQYIALCGEKDVVNLTFLERASLVTWLEGADEQSDYIVSDTGTAAATAQAVSEPKAAAAAATTLKTAGAEGVEAKVAAARVKRPVDPRLERTYAIERVLVNRNTVLRGIKQTDFSYVRKEATESFIRSHNRSASGAQPARQRGGPYHTSSQRGPSTVAGPAPSSGQSTKRRDPIILLSPSASSLLTMSNVKDFLERGTYVAAPPSSSAVNIQMINRNSNRLGQVRFVVVDSCERFKPDYWDRVVAVFTTGQAWQFKLYKWHNPHELFQRVKGFCVTFSGDPVPESVRAWNVDVVQVDKVHRFRDRETVEGLWDVLEKWMEARGWSGKGKPVS
ncbi:RNA pol II accessory factor, Cdc73 family-domain-containing protein [Lipomyces kononenkoae]|uniref:RNA pol II accessory factor, Cdc73 family-domain-containing protein n=1 Tax=Lipomyces kononenkoae TaxID=34357 RepID=A0ACC3TBW1_LIPKO